MKFHFYNTGQMGIPKMHPLDLVSQEQTHGIQQNGLSGPGFSGNHRQTRPEPHLQFGNERKIPDMQARQHSKAFDLFATPGTATPDSATSGPRRINAVVFGLVDGVHGHQLLNHLGFFGRQGFGAKPNNFRKFTFEVQGD